MADNSNARAWFGAPIVIILLSLYVYIFFRYGVMANCETDEPNCSFTPAMSQAFSWIAGLVSALVIAQLAIAEPGDVPSLLGVRSQTPGSWQSILQSSISIVCMLVWTSVGLYAFILGLDRNPSLPKELVAYGQSWIGLAISAGYAYLGISKVK